MTQKQEISKDYRLNDIVLQLGLTDARFNTVELKLPGDGSRRPGCQKVRNQSSK